MKRQDQVEFQLIETNCYEHGKEYDVLLKIPMNVGWIDSAFFVLEDGSKTSTFPVPFFDNQNGKACFKTHLFLENRAVYRYYFVFYAHGKKWIINNQTIKDTIEYDEKNKISVGFQAPDWAKGAMMYHIFVDRFYRGSKEPLKKMERRYVHDNWDEDVMLGDNPHVIKHDPLEEVWNVDFYGGDLKGIEEKLDYIASLGVNLLYLSPIVSSQSNHRYDASDYEKVDPYVGVNDDLKSLCLEAHKRGMKVIVDAVFNHVGDESKYFDRYGEFRTPNPIENGAYQNPQSKYYDFFRHNACGGNTFWWDFSTLPELNCDSSFWRNYICGEGGVIDQWFHLGIDGLRLDVADNLSDAALEEIHKAVVRNKKDGFILGEVWDNPMRNGRSYIASGKSMHSVMNYPLVDALVRYIKYQNPFKLSYTLRDIQAEYPKDTIDTSMNFSSTHDISRAITLFGKKEFDSKRLFHQLDGHLQSRVFEALWEMGYSNDDIMALLHGDFDMNYYDYQRMMGILQGKGLDWNTIQYLKSILSFSPFDSYQVWAKDLPEDIKRDLNYTKNYMLTKDEYQKAKDLYQSYLLFLATYPGIFSLFYGDEAGMQGLNNLANRRSFPWNHEDKELLDYVKQLGQLRKQYPFLREARFQLLSLTGDQLSYERVDDYNQMFVLINNSSQEQRIYLPDSYREGNKVLCLKNHDGYLSPHGGIVIKK